MKIAIQGHPTRGKEIIQILESLGGINKYCFEGYKNSLAYYIYESGNIGWADLKLIKNEYKLYTLEEFEKEFPFKVGDKVTFKDDDYPYTIKAFDIWSDGDIVCEFVENGLHYSINKIKLYKEMERNITLSLEKAKEWYKKGGELREIALQAFSEKELNPLPRSWKEFCEKYPIKFGETYVDGSSKFIGDILGTRHVLCDKNICPSQKSAEAHLTMIQLEQLRDCWWNGWEPTWDISEKWCIRLWGNELSIGIATNISRFLTFPTKEMAEEFLKCFRDLIELAKDLI